jgi:hypothetical protein
MKSKRTGGCQQVLHKEASGSNTKKADEVGGRWRRWIGEEEEQAQPKHKKSQPLGLKRGGPCALFSVFELVVKQDGVCHARPANTGLLTGLVGSRKEKQSSIV